MKRRSTSFVSERSTRTFPGNTCFLLQEGLVAERDGRGRQGQNIIHRKLVVVRVHRLVVELGRAGRARDTVLSQVVALRGGVRLMAVLHLHVVGRTRLDGPVSDFTGLARRGPYHVLVIVIGALDLLPAHTVVPYTARLALSSRVRHKSVWAHALTRIGAGDHRGHARRRRSVAPRAHVLLTSCDLSRKGESVERWMPMKHLLHQPV